MHLSRLFLVPLIFLASCGKLEEPKQTYELIPGRDQQNTYRVRVPADWVLKKAEGSLVDTTLPLCEFWAADSIRITIHNFPGLKVPPEAQISRWKRQFDQLSDIQVVSQAFSGFVGLKSEASGTMQGKDVKLLGWSLQIAPEFASSVKGQSGADVTIKIVGPSELVDLHYKELERFARSFELIEDL